jgi:hypothetical protein
MFNNCPIGQIIPIMAKRMPRRPYAFSPSSHRQRQTSPRILKFLPYLVIVMIFFLALRAWTWIWDQPKAAPTQPSTVLAERTVETPTTLNQNFLDQIEQCFIPTAKIYGYRLDITWGFRSSQEQDALYAQGRTTPGDIVTNARGGSSLHNYGYAVDVVDIDQNYDIDWQRLGKIGAYCGLEHGDRGHEDLPHFQYRGNLSLDDFRQGYRPSPLTLPCPVMAERHRAGQSLSKSDLRPCGQLPLP